VTHKTLTYVTLTEFADAMGFDADVVRDTLDQRGVTFGGTRGEQVLMTVARLCQLCEYDSWPMALEAMDFVLLDA
jgi:hypothetical protein